MQFTDVLSLIGGLCLFLFGMETMGTALEKRAGSKLRGLIGKLTTNRLTGFLTGLGVTAVIQSSSATTVMVVGFVNSGVMTLKQAINVIMGANVGTTVTAWLLSLTGVSGDSFLVTMLKPTSFTPILALIGIIMIMFIKSDKKKDTGTILLGFATLMFGMDIMSSAVAGLRDVPQFANILLAFSNPILGVLAGALLTAIIQSSSASVGILQALTATGQVTIGTSIPIIFGQNIGTCITAMLSSVGTTKNARRAALVHLSFNIIGTAFWLTLFTIANRIFIFEFVNSSANAASIAIIHSIFNIACTACLLPMAGILERFAIRLIPDEAAAPDAPETLLDERLLSTPSFAIERCRDVSVQMAQYASRSIEAAISLLDSFDPEVAAETRALEDKTDIYEDRLGSYLVKLSAQPMSVADSNESNKILHIIGDLERIADYAVNITESAEEIQEKNVVFSEQAKCELGVLTQAVQDIVSMACITYCEDDTALANRVEPLEQVVDDLREQLRARHIARLQAGECTLEAGFVLSDLLTNLERVADHCSNIAACVIEMQHSDLDLHAFVHEHQMASTGFRQEYQSMLEKYAID